MMIDEEKALMVSIHCLVYNHEPYLRQCLEGFVMQKTTFRFEAIVHDDCSIDGSRAIIEEYSRKYPDIIKPIYETENQYSKQDGSLERMIYNNTKGKYMAFCEGDDYWIDPNKLQKQYDVLEGDKSVELCYTRSRVFYEDTRTFASYLNADNGPKDFAGIMLREPAMTLTSFFKSTSYKEYMNDVKPLEKKWLMGDTPLFLWLAQKGKVVLLSDITAVYRMLGESASHSSNIDKLLAFNKSTRDIRLYFCEKYDREDLVQEVNDAYCRCNMRDADKNSVSKLFWGNFIKIKRKRFADFVFLLAHFKHCVFKFHIEI